MQSEIVTNRVISGADACAPGRPAVLPIAKVKLHYVVHYLHRGTFNHVVPELQGADRERVDAYVCNICQKPFRQGSVGCRFFYSGGVYMGYTPFSMG